MSSITRRKEMAVQLWRGLRKDTRQELLGHQVMLHPHFDHYLDNDDAWTLLLCAQADALLDIGCNRGVTSLRGGLVNPDLTMVCVDAGTDMVAYAARCLITNGMSRRSRFVTALVGARTGDTVAFYTYGLAPGSSSYADDFTAQGVAPIQLETVTIDDLCREQGVHPDLVKVDVEGAEADVLAGAGELVAAGRTRFIVEMHDKGITMAANARLVLDWCDANGMEAYYLKTHERLTTPDTIAARGRCHLLLLPAGADYPEGLADIPEGATLEVAQRVIATVVRPE